MNVDDLVRVTGCPPIPADDLSWAETKEIFDQMIGHEFRIVDITDGGRAELHVGKILGIESYVHSVWVEPEYLETVRG